MQRIVLGGVASFLFFILPIIGFAQERTCQETFLPGSFGYYQSLADRKDLQEEVPDFYNLEKAVAISMGRRIKKGPEILHSILPQENQSYQLGFISEKRPNTDHPDWAIQMAHEGSAMLLRYQTELKGGIRLGTDMMVTALPPGAVQRRFEKLSHQYSYITALKEHIEEFSKRHRISFHDVFMEERQRVRNEGLEMDPVRLAFFQTMEKFMAAPNNQVRRTLLLELTNQFSIEELRTPFWERQLRDLLTHIDHFMENQIQYLYTPEDGFWAVTFHMHGGGTPTAEGATGRDVLNHLAPYGVATISMDSVAHGAGPQYAFSSAEELYDFYYKVLEDLVHPDVSLFVDGHSKGGLDAVIWHRLASGGKYPRIEGFISLSGVADIDPGGDFIQKQEKEREIARTLLEDPKYREYSPRDWQFLDEMVRQGKIAPVTGYHLAFLNIVHDGSVPDLKDLKPLIGVIGLRDLLTFVGREEAFYKYYSDVHFYDEGRLIEVVSNSNLPNSTLHVLDRMPTRDGMVPTGHMIFDAYFSEESDRLFYIEKMLDFMSDLVGVEVTRDHPLHHSDGGPKGSFAESISKVLQLYSNNLVFREYMDSHQVYFYDQSPELKRASQNSKARELFANRLLRTEKQNNQDFALASLYREILSDSIPDRFQERAQLLLEDLPRPEKKNQVVPNNLREKTKKFISEVVEYESFLGKTDIRDAWLKLRAEYRSDQFFRSFLDLEAPEGMPNSERYSELQDRLREVFLQGTSRGLPIDEKVDLIRIIEEGNAWALKTNSEIRKKLKMALIPDDPNIAPQIEEIVQELNKAAQKIQNLSKKRSDAVKVLAEVLLKKQNYLKTLKDELKNTQNPEFLEQLARVNQTLENAFQIYEEIDSIDQSVAFTTYVENSNSIHPTLLDRYPKEYFDKVSEFQAIMQTYQEAIRSLDKEQRRAAVMGERGEYVETFARNYWGTPEGSPSSESLMGQAQDLYYLINRYDSEIYELRGQRHDFEREYAGFFPDDYRVSGLILSDLFEMSPEDALSQHDAIVKILKDFRNIMETNLPAERRDVQFIPGFD